MLIRDLEQQTGLDRATIRYYEKEGLITPERKENGYRHYSQEIAHDLIKIKLLRQLGVSLEMIKNIQQGSEDFSAVMNQQLVQLESKITSYQQAKIVCKRICDDRVSYSTMDADYYWNLLNQPAQNNASPLPRAYQEAVKKPFHPWRRFFARGLDLVLFGCIVRFVLIVLLRIRPFTFPGFILNYGCYLLMVPVEALLIHFFGTTPGKWVMGIHVESIDGGHHDYITALRRAYWAFHHGCGLYIPFWEIWRYWKSYKDYENGETLNWDVESEITYTKWKTIEQAGCALILCLIVCLNTWNAADVLLPRNRDTFLTIQEFVENYNVIKDTLEIHSVYALDSTGKWKDMRDYSDNAIISFGGEEERPDYIYQLADGKIKGVIFKQELTPEICTMIPDHCLILACTMVASQEKTSSFQIRSMLEYIVASIGRVERTNDNTYYLKDSIVCNAVTVSWEVIISNASVASSGTVIGLDNKSNASNALYQITFQIDITE